MPGTNNSEELNTLITAECFLCVTVDHECSVIRMFRNEKESVTNVRVLPSRTTSPPLRARPPAPAPPPHAQNPCGGLRVGGALLRLRGVPDPSRAPAYAAPSVCSIDAFRSCAGRGTLVSKGAAERHVSSSTHLPRCRDFAVASHSGPVQHLPPRTRSHHHPSQLHRIYQKKNSQLGDLPNPPVHDL